MKKLIYYVPGQCKSLEHRPDAKIFLAIFKIFTDNISFVDRSNVIVPPIYTETPNHIKLPEPNPAFNLSFDECAIARAQEIYNKHLEHGVPIKLAWSGGTDSSAALMAFIELLGIQKAKESLEIVMTSNGIVENPYIWEKIVRKENFKLVNTMNFTEKWDGSEIMVNGEAGDQVHGTDIYRALRRMYGKESMTMLWTRERILQHIKWKATELTEHECEVLADIFIRHINSAPIEITTLADFWWWINFSCKWGSTIYRLVAKSPHPVDADFINNYFFPFYASEKFQLWSMYKREEKHKGNWETYKWKAKEFVCKTSGCDELYLKHRQGSLFTVLTHTNKFEAIDNEFNFYKNINPEDWYNPNNSFKV
jgi:hypothetical protein